MIRKATKPQPPRGWRRVLFRLPIWLYRLRLGRLLGYRFLLIHHVGRKTGLPRQAVVEVVRYDREQGVFIVAAAFGRKTDWYQNILKQPEVTIQVGGQTLAATAEPLAVVQGGAEMVDYARRHPGTARALSRMLGYVMDGTEDDYRQLGESIPFVAFRINQTNF
ncbi:MAG: nitroreductase family deazaflavin-dependent oxidoreductase [Chloroflexi bacterium]|nr:MAG: nitroreductase family deazaflavin-dependent oxidoreductase [Chloroflexota bacterium]